MLFLVLLYSNILETRVTDYSFNLFISSYQTYLLFREFDLFLSQAILKKQWNFKNRNSLTQLTPVSKNVFLRTIYYGRLSSDEQ